MIKGLSRRLTIRMHHSAKLLVEPVIFGRHAMGETQISGFFRDQIDLWVGEAWCMDVALLSGDITAKLARPPVLVPWPHAHRAPDAARLCRAIQPSSTTRQDAASSLLIAAAGLAHDGYALRQSCCRSWIASRKTPAKMLEIINAINPKGKR